MSSMINFNPIGKTITMTLPFATMSTRSKVDLFTDLGEHLGIIQALCKDTEITQDALDIIDTQIAKVLKQSGDLNP